MRVGIISLIHESNTFAVPPTTIDLFRRDSLLIGEVSETTVAHLRLLELAVVQTFTVTVRDQHRATADHGVSVPAALRTGRRAAEATGVAVRRIIRRIDAHALRGTLTLVPVVNESALSTTERVHADTEPGAARRILRRPCDAGAGGRRGQSAGRRRG